MRKFYKWGYFNGEYTILKDTDEFFSVKYVGCRIWSMFLVIIMKREGAKDLESLVKYSENSCIMILQTS